jgi:VWFA-related protein
MKGLWATALALATLVGAGAAQEPGLSITAPQRDTVAIGPGQIAVVLSPAAGVQEVSFFVDGRLLCTATRPPFTCPWDAGPVVRGHHVRVVATLEGGRRLVDNVRTRELGYAERTRVDAVLVPVIVTEHGRFVRDLKRQDFEVIEDGVAQRLVGFASEDSPLDLVVAIDISGSMESALPDVQAAVKQFLSRLRAGDAATLLGFNDTTFLVAEREKDQQAREDAIDLLAPWGGTALYDATVRAVDLIDRSTGRKGVIVFSDGDDRHSLTPPEMAAARVQGGNAMLYTVGFGAGSSVASLRERLASYAESTGGRAFYPNEVSELDGVFGVIVTELANQYVLSYVSSNTRQDGRWRSIKVRVSNGKYDVRARRGYQASGTRRAEKVMP